MLKKILFWVLVVAIVTGINIGVHFIWLDLGILVNLVTFFTIAKIAVDAEQAEWWADVRRRHDRIHNEAVIRLGREWVAKYQRGEMSREELEARLRLLREEIREEAPC